MFLWNQNSLYKEKFEGALLNKDSIEVVILGNSHANYGVDPSAFKSFTYNLANVSQSIYFDKRITLSLLPELKKLKYVFISVDYHNLYFSSQGVRDNWSYYGNGIKYKNTNYFLANLSPSLFGYTWKVSFSLLKKRIGNKLRYGQKAVDFDVEEGVNVTIPIKRGFVSLEKTNEHEFTKEYYRTRNIYFNDIIKSSNEKEEILKDLDDFVQILLAHHVTPIIFTSPTFIEYNKFLDTSVLDGNAKDIFKLCSKYKIEYWDFMNSNVFSKDDFNNVDHLNSKGALKFGRLLNDSLINFQKKRVLEKY